MQDETRLAHDPPTSTSGWLTSTEAIDHGRFAPGVVLDGRYRVIGRLGRGGMGEVYRADDLRLAQPVALKFLPEEVDRDPARLSQLHAEVRMARQVSHPNVCRVYDVGEVEGHTFLSMEFVDGEDLSSLLRRVGRFPQERGLELARQICAGLAAAHERGVVHRDLKPANIMLDGTGRIRITDFGLAGAAGEALQAGTPAYMAPEQLAGLAVTPRSDLYSLGLVLYELFTGKRAVEARNLAELIARREQAEITAPSSIVRDLDPAVERTIMRCLEPNAEARPATALAVAAALPGGDPIAAALAAGETPSPEMVAAAGKTSALAPLPALLTLASVIVSLAVCVGLADRILLTSLVPLPKPPLLLAERAKEILASAGYPADSPDSATGLGVRSGVLEYIRAHPRAADEIRSGDPPVIQFWRRGAPAPMVPATDRNSVSLTDPPLLTSGMTLLKLDPAGRLLELEVIPPQVDAATAPAPIDWRPLFAAAGLDMGAFKTVASEWTPRQFADTRAAWVGAAPGLPGEELRIEAAGYRGRAVYFQQISSWMRPTRTAEASAEFTRASIWSSLITVAVFGMFAAAALIARHNLRRQRGDRRAAFQLAAFVTVLAVINWILDGKHFANPQMEMNRFFVGQPLWAAGLLYLIYLALEPYVRRFWPRTVVSWSRLMTRQWRDPLVGRDILIGLLLGLGTHVLELLHQYALVGFGYYPAVRVPALDQLLGFSAGMAHELNQVFNAVINGLFAVFGMVLLKILVRRERLTAPLAILLMTFTSSQSIFETGPPLLNLALTLVFITIIVLTIQRLGLLATMALFLADFLISDAILTADTGKWFFGMAMMPVVLLSALACWSFYVARGGEPIFGRRLLE